MKTRISILAIDVAKGSFPVCAVGPDGAVLSNRAISRSRLAALLAETQARAPSIGLEPMAPF